MSVASCQAGEGFTFQAECSICFIPVVFKETRESIVVKMNLEGIHLVVGQQFHVVAQEMHRNEFSSTVEHHTSDGVVGPVADATFGKCKTMF